MEKLLNYLYECNGDYREYNEEYGPYMPGMDRDAYQYHKYYLVSRAYGFIKRLVDNDKIDREGLEFSFYIRIRNKITHSDYVSKEEILLMLLAISDTPIDDLISYLK